MTEAGAAFQQTAADVLARLDQARDDAEAGASRLAGPIRITAPLSFGVTHLAPALAAFVAGHAEVVLDVRLDDQVVDLQAGGFDLGIRIGRPPNSSLTPRRLTLVRPYVVGSLDYLARRGRPAVPSHLAGHDVLVYVNADLEAWRAAFPKLDIGRLNVRFRSDNGDTLREAAIAGLGLLILPDFLVAASVKGGRLEPLLPSHPLASAAIYAVSPPGRPILRRVRALVEHLATAFGPMA
ncbi:MAG: Transcriptional regulator, LysR family [uncultured Sphingomonas sp.]|uniref:Transcriptional regulator, LysR family n=1 Tax=uncultured Sphingomonas sp. TaxID=158754 RepID=A0A6J4THV3_9SPHN|nr:substrate binding domain-containing protein [uncultured Sphingomonas sp.]CAA9523653.1 MAG: Transcriptional regulator, LysR family [uncultured Sphingomonas sp.]